MPRRDDMARHLLGLLGLCVLLITGCGGMDFGGEIRVPADQRHVLAADSASSDQILLPGDRTFNIHLKNSSQNPDAEGQARGDSDATAEGNAMCVAEADNGGSAMAEFKLGHRIDHQSKKQQVVTIQTEFELEQSIDASPLPAAETLASMNLMLVILDSKSRSVASLNITQTTSDSALSSTKATSRPSIRVVFEPDQSYNIVLFGKVDASSAQSQKASARLSVRNLKMRLTFAPAVTETKPATEP